MNQLKVTTLPGILANIRALGSKPQTMLVKGSEGTLFQHSNCEDGHCGNVTLIDRSLQPKQTIRLANGEKAIIKQEGSLIVQLVEGVKSAERR